MRVLITGAAGCLGSNLAERLIARGVAVKGIDNYRTGRRDLAIDGLPSIIVEGDVADRALVEKVFSDFQPTHVVHAAASYNDPDDWSGDVSSNVTGTINVTRAALACGSPRMVYLQTALCYGTPMERPVTTRHRLAPFTSYAISKTAGEQYLAMSGLPHVSLRIANVYGPRAYSGPIPTFFKRLKAGQPCFLADTRRDFLEMEDFLDLMDLVLLRGDVCGPLNVSSGHDVSIRELFETMVSLMKIELDEPVKVNPPGADDVSTLLLDPEETRQVLGWKASTPLRNGLQRQIDWFEKHGVGATFTHLASARG